MMLPPTLFEGCTPYTTHVTNAADVSQGNLVGRGEGLPAEHVAVPPTYHCPSGANDPEQCARHHTAEEGLRPFSVAPRGAVERHQGPTRSALSLSESDLLESADQQRRVPPPSAPSHNSVSLLPGDGHFLQSNTIPAIDTSAQSTLLPACRGSVGTLGTQSPLSACTSSTHTSLTAAQAFAERGELHEVRHGATPCHPPSSAQLIADVHGRLSRVCAGVPSLSDVLFGEHRLSPDVCGNIARGSFFLYDLCLGGSEGGATVVTDTQLMQSDASRATILSATLLGTTGTAHTHTFSSPSRTDMRRGSATPTLTEYTTGLFNKSCDSTNSSVAATESALLPTSSSPFSLPYEVFLAAAASESRSDVGEEERRRGDAATAAAAMTMVCSMTSMCCPMTAPATETQQGGLHFSPAPCPDVQVILSAASPGLRTLLVTEFDRAVRALQRQEVWAEQTASGRDRLRRQTELHILAKHRLLEREVSVGIRS